MCVRVYIGGNYNDLKSHVTIPRHLEHRHPFLHGSSFKCPDLMVFEGSNRKGGW